MWVEVQVFAFMYVFALMKKTYLLFHPLSVSPPTIKNEPVVDIKLNLQITQRFLIS